VEIPASVEVIKTRAFSNCTALREVIFATASCLRVMNGFQQCRSLCRLDLPASVERISSSDDNSRHMLELESGLSLEELVLPSGTRVQPVARDDQLRAFITFADENDVKRQRRQVHQRLAGFSG
jgi:hypothetical protein